MTPRDAADATAQPSVVGRTANIGLLQRQLRQARADGQADLARDLAVRLATLRPDHAALQRQASLALVQADQYDDALGFARRAFDLDPDQPGHRMLLGKLMNIAQDCSGAMVTLFPLLESGERTGELYHQIAVAAEGLGDLDLAVDLERKACNLEPDRAPRAMAFANLLSRAGRTPEAIAHLDAFRADPEHGAVVDRTLSALHLSLDDDARALALIEAAIARAPERHDFLMQRISILRRIGDIDAARTAVAEFLTREPGNLRLKRNLVALDTQAGDHDAALRGAAELIALAPDVEEYAACMRSLLEAREVRAGQSELGDIAKLKQGPTAARQYRTAPTFRASARSKANIIAALVMRDIRTRYGRNRLGFLWALFEPMAHIAILAVVFIVTMRTNPPLGSNYLLFYLTGVAPYLLFNHISSAGGHGISGGRNLMQLPGITPTDIVVAKAVVELFVTALVLIIFGLGFVAAGIPGLPANPGPVFAALGMAFAMGIGTAGIYATLFEFGKLVDMVFKALFRAMYMTSGIFFLPATVPEGWRAILNWNPFVHVIDLARTGYYPFYDSGFADVPYALVASLFILVTGLGLIALATPIMRSAR